MFTTLPLTINKKLFTKLTADKTCDFFKNMTQNFEKLFVLRDRVKTKEIEVEEIIHHLRAINNPNQKACSLSRVIIENKIFEQDIN